jgi:Zn-finger nucleic acid-binding protein
MKCPHDIENTLTELHVGGTVAHVCNLCHGLFFRKTELEVLKDHIESHGWFDVSLWEKKELLSAKEREEKCSECSTIMREVDWNNGEMVALLCPSCGSMWLPKGEYQKAIRYIKDEADTEVIRNYGGLLSHEIEQLLGGKRDVAHEAHNLRALLSFFTYRFMATHPVLTEVIEELPLSK